MIPGSSSRYTSPPHMQQAGPIAIHRRCCGRHARQQQAKSQNLHDLADCRLGLQAGHTAAQQRTGAYTGDRGSRAADVARGGHACEKYCEGEGAGAGASTHARQTHAVGPNYTVMLRAGGINMPLCHAAANIPATCIPATSILASQWLVSPGCGSAGRAPVTASGPCAAATSEG